MDALLLNFLLSISTLLSLWNPVVQTRDTVLHAWNGTPSPYEISWSAATAGIWVLYSTVNLHELTLLVLKLVALLVESCCCVAVVHNSRGNMTDVGNWLVCLLGLIPNTVGGVSVFFGVNGVGMIASIMHATLLIWKYKEMKEVWENKATGHHSLMHAFFYALNAFIWTVYAYQKHDNLLMVPNLLLGVAGVLFMMLLWIMKKEDEESKPLLS